MLSWLSNPTILAAGVILAAVQFAAALPWLWAIDPRGFERTTRSGRAVGTIALDHGFSQISFFNRLFRREFGMTPTAYRERQPGIRAHTTRAS